MESFQTFVRPIFVSEVLPLMSEFPLRPIMGRKASSGSDSTGTEDVQGQIGLRLRALYETIVSEPVPDRFQTLLESLDCSNAPKT